jgi:hypothetical protein
LQYGVNPDIECLKEACRIINVDIINKILMYKITPTSVCIDALLSSCNLGYGKHRESPNAKKVASVIDMLVSFGYKLTYDDVYKALLKGCYVNDISRFNIKFDAKFLETCTKHSFYPYNDIGVKPTLECLRIESKRINNVQNMKKIISEGPKPDSKCLVQACDNKTNIQNIRFLVENHGIKPNIDCLKALSRHIGNPTLTYLLNHMDNNDNANNIANNDIANNDIENNDIANNENIELQTNEPNEPNEKIEINKQVSNNLLDDDMSEFKKYVTKSQKIMEVQTIMDQRMEEFNETINIIQNAPNGKRKGRKLNVIVDDSIQDQSNKIYNVVRIKSSKEKRVNTKEKYIINVLSNYLFGPNIQEKITVYEARKILLDYVTQQKLVDGDKKNLIKIDEKLSKLLKIKKGNYVDFSDIDHMACKMLKI